MNILIEDLDISNKEELLITAYADEYDSYTDYHLHSDGFHAIIKGDKLKVVIYPYCGPLKLFYKDPQNYVYLTDEDIIIPKQLASSVSNNRKKKAPKELCFATVNATFLPIPLHKCEFFYDEQQYRKEYRSRRNYIKADVEHLS